MNTWSLPHIKEELRSGSATVTARIQDTEDQLTLRPDFSEQEREILIAGGLLAFLRERADPR